MILADHNAHLVNISTPAIPVDAGKGIVGSPAVSRWAGDIQAVVQDTLVESVSEDGGRVELLTTLVYLPANMPTVPVINDLLSLKMLRDLTTQVLIVRQSLDRFYLAGYVQFLCRRT